ncbi:MAG: hypothetical protein KTR13_00515 [Saprospiraceae bacterium]|nr:hypothetical protein [Saprospiraceae bacterium]
MEKSNEAGLTVWESLQLKYHNFMCKPCAWFFRQSKLINKHASRMDEHIDAQLTERQKLEMKEIIERNS